jgi:2-dehydro-3-deoxyphosphogluconate aldolase/(4S)-4-hydroxy-2-oxoglutarate aldolase
MDKDLCLARILDCGLVPIVRLDSAEAAYETAVALHKGEVDIVEITLAVPNALSLITSLRAKFGDDVVVGAGTVLDSQSARLAILAGAQFIVSPNLDLGLIETCRRYGCVCIPGAMTPTEILTAWTNGADMVKVFPAGLMGGPKYIAAIKEVFPYIKLLGLGKVSLDTTVDYLRSGADAVGVGAALVDKKDIAEKHFENITEKAIQFRNQVAIARNLNK